MRKKRIILITLIASILALKHFGMGILFKSNLELKVITHQDVPVTEMKLSDVGACFKGEKVRWKNKTKIKIAIMKSISSIGKLTAERILEMTPNEMDKFYLLNVFQGNMEAPKTFNSEKQLIEYVAETPGAIGVVDDDENLVSVKVIKIK